MKLKIENFFHDVLILGSGGAGLAAAVYCREKDLTTAIVSKVHPLKSHTIAAQGGINASLGNITPDNWRWHAFDTIKASDWLADQDSVEEMCQKAPHVIKMLSEIGVDFDKINDDKIDQKIYGGQSTEYGKGALAYRACFSKDRTGHSIMHRLYDEAVKKGVDFYNYNFVIDLLYEQKHCYGAVCWDISNGQLNIIRANNVIIATGGYSQIYETATSAAICTGDGNGLIARLNIGLQDMEFVQFHPTALSKIGILITEAARSAGGILRNSAGERFMEKYAPKFKELAARDVVARAIANEIAHGRGCGSDKNSVFLDLTHLSRQEIIEKLPTVFENCTQFAMLDPSRDFIPIAPAAHYTMGGIPTNNRCQVVEYSLSGENVIGSLYAIGEAASISVHGAGRLGCNSLLDLFVFAKKVVECLEEQNSRQDSIACQNRIIKNFQAIFDKKPVNIDSLSKQLKNVMSAHVGVFRCKNSLELALKEMLVIEKIYLTAGIKDKSLQWNTQLQHYLELGNMIISAKYTIRSALWRKESRGAHWRSDFQELHTSYLGHTICTNDAIYLRPIRLSKENVDFYHPEKRNY